MQSALLLTAVAPLCVYVAYRQVPQGSPSHYIILVVAAAVAICAAFSWLQWLLAKRPLIIVGDASLKIRNPLSASYEEVPWARIADIQAKDEIKSNVLRHRFVASIDGLPRDIPTPSLADPAQAEQAILAAWQSKASGRP